MDVIKNNRCDVFILDEIMGVLTNKLLREQQVIKLIDSKPVNIEPIFIGKNVPDSIREREDLIIEINGVKHYIDKEVYSREGIEY